MSQVPPNAPLPADSEAVATDTNTPTPYRSPLPALQLAILCAVRLIDPVTFTQIFPYISQFLTGLHLVEDQSQIGFYSGLVESTFAFFQLVSIYQWAKMSEKLGRRPIVLCGTFGLAFATTALGLTSSLWAILLCRALAGLFSGNAAVLHSILGELTDSTNQHIAFPLYGLFWPLGSIVGPIIGGSLASPAERYPTLFGYQFLRDFPYFLPCLAAGLFTFVTATIAAIYLKEVSGPPFATGSYQQNQTHPSRQAHASGERLPSYRSLNFALALPEHEKLSLHQLLSIPVIRSLSVSGASLCFTATAFDAVFVLFCYTSIPDGGLDFSTAEIGYALAIAGTSSIAIQTLVLPSLLTAFGHAKLYNFCMFMWPLAYIFMPFLNLFAASTAALWTAIACLLSLSRIACLAYSISMILVKEHAPSPFALGQSNGLVLFCMCISRAFAPAFVSCLFVLSIRNNILGGYMWTWVMVSISLLGCSLSRSISSSDRQIQL